jgi:hypothetical protein
MLARLGTDTGEQVRARGTDAHGVIAPQFASCVPIQNTTCALNK